MMGKLTVLCVLLLLAVLNVAVTGGTVTTVYFKDGGDLTLEVRPASTGHITNILWKFNGNLLAEWVEKLVPLFYYPRIDGRATLTIETGQLIINKMKKDDEGVYSVSINDIVQSESYRAKMINTVHKPKVLLRTLTCGADSKSCNLTCDSDTTGAEPITYSWKKGDGEWKVLRKDIDITRKDDLHVKTFSCRMENPVSQEESDPEPNLLYKEEEPDSTGAVVGKVVGGLFGFIVAVAGVGFFVAWMKKIGPFNKGSLNIPDSANENVESASRPGDSSLKTAEKMPLQANPEHPKSDTKETAEGEDLKQASD